MVAARVANMGEGRPKRETGGIQPVSQSRAAELLNTSRDSVKAARKVLEKGAPELVRAVDQGRIAVSAAKTITALPEPDQKRIALEKDDRQRRRLVQEAKQRAEEVRRVRQAQAPDLTLTAQAPSRRTCTGGTWTRVSAGW
jgi:hypothetical protein